MGLRLALVVTFILERRLGDMAARAAAGVSWQRDGDLRRVTSTNTTDTAAVVGGVLVAFAAAHRGGLRRLNIRHHRLRHVQRPVLRGRHSHNRDAR